MNTPTVYDFNWICRDEHGLLNGFKHKPKQIKENSIFSFKINFYPIKGDKRTVIPEPSNDFNFIGKYELLHISEIGQYRRNFYEGSEK